MNSGTLTELAEILSHYDLGQPIGSELNDRGFVNTSYAITTASSQGERNTYFLRKYKPGIQEDELIFEHSLMRHLANKGVCPVAWVHPTRAGMPYLLRYEGEVDIQPRYYAIFDFLPGEDRYTWINPRCTPAEISNSAGVFARFHRALFDWSPEGVRFEAKILDLLPQILTSLQGIKQHSKGTIFDDYLHTNLDLLINDLQTSLTALSEDDVQRMPQMVIHCDYHPGNLKFTGDQVTALFDFDWSKVDYRCFDVALALYYFFTSWEVEDGQFRLEDASLFLKTYQETLTNGQTPGPLDANELKYLPAMINAANIYVLNWTIVDFYQKPVDPQEYLPFLAHAVEFIRWLNADDHRAQLTKMINGIAPAGSQLEAHVTA
jgi:homoserine kinase type II